MNYENDLTISCTHNVYTGFTIIEKIKTKGDTRWDEIFLYREKQNKKTNTKLNLDENGKIWSIMFNDPTVDSWCYLESPI